MKTKTEIQEYIRELEGRHHSSPNMGYERAGAISALKWVLDKGKRKPVIGYRV